LDNRGQKVAFVYISCSCPFSGGGQPSFWFSNQSYCAKAQLETDETRSDSVHSERFEKKAFTNSLCLNSRFCKKFHRDCVQGINGDGKLLAFNVEKDQLCPSQNLEIDFKDGSSLVCFLDEEGQLPIEIMQFRSIQPNSENSFSVAEEMAQYSFTKKTMLLLQKFSSGFFF
jgi:hypothetical protein